MYITMVPPGSAPTFSHGTGVFESSAACPVARNTHEEECRLVSEKPDKAAAAEAAVTPGMITAGMPAADRYSASSPLLP